MDQLGHQNLSNILHYHLKNRKTNIVSLAPYYPMRGAKRDMKWRVAVNALMESDVHDSDKYD